MGPIRILNPPSIFAGGLHGFSGPLLVADLQVELADQQILAKRLHAALCAQFQSGDGGLGGAVPPVEPGKPILAMLLVWTFAFQRNAGFPVFEAGRIIEADQSGQIFQIALPATPMGFDLIAKCFGTLATLANLLELDQDIQPAMANLADIRTAMAQFRFKSGQMDNFLLTAHEIGAPFGLVTVADMDAGGFYQFGQGRYERWLDLAFTDLTSNLGARLARQKPSCANRLRQMGLPVPQHVVVRSETDAIKAAQALGYPVVAKPADYDGGHGVTPGIRNAAALRAAYAQAQEYSDRIIIEKHVPGDDHRLVVLEGQMICAIRRRPAGVVGDGQHTIAQLAEEANKDPTRGDGPGAVRARLSLDREALALLEEARLDPQSVLAAGQFAAFKTAANFGLGGSAEIVTDKVHPDNVALVIRIAEALRLDLAGVDLLIEDISRSWQEIGGGICEVNAQPQLGGRREPNIYAMILRNLLQGNGRVPIALILGTPDQETFTDPLVRRLRENGLRTGLVDQRGVSIDGESILQPGAGLFKSCKILLSDKSLEALIVIVYNMEVLDESLPFGRYDLLMLACEPPVGDDGARIEQGVWDKKINAITDNCDGIFSVIRGFEQAIPAGRADQFSSLTQKSAVKSATTAMLDANARHRGA